MKYDNNSQVTLESLIKYLNENSSRVDDKQELEKRIKHVLSCMDHVYSQSLENHKELMQFLLIMTIKYKCLVIEEYETAYNLWRDKIDIIYTKYLNSVQGEMSESMVTLLEIELICSYKLHNLTSPLKEVLKRINIRNIKVPENHNLYTNFVFSGIHIEAYGYFIRVLLETESLKDADIMGYICPYFSVCLANFNDYKDVVYLNGLLQIEEGLKFINASRFILKITEFYKTLFSLLFNNMILQKVPDGKDKNGSGTANATASYDEKDVHRSFISIFENLDESTPIEYLDILLNIIHDYIKSSYRYFDIGYPDSISKLKDSKIPIFKYELLDRYLYLKGPSLIKSSFENKDYENVNGIYRIMKEKAKIISLRRCGLEIAYSMWSAGDREGAKKVYEYALTAGVRNISLYNNLANIYFEEKEYNKALYLYNMALGMEPENKTIKGLKEKVEREIRRQQEREDRIIDIYLNKIKSSQKAAIFAVYRSQGSPITHEMLSKISGENIDSVKGSLTFLISNGLLIPAGENIYTLEPSIKKVVEKNIFSASNNLNISRFYNPLLYPDYKITLYKLLTDIFPGYEVFPNIPLKTIFDKDILELFLDNKTVSSLLASTLDYCIVNASTYLPILGFDGTIKQYGNPEVEMGFETKQVLLKLLGFPLVEIPQIENMQVEHLKTALINSVRNLILEIKNCPSFYDASLLEEIDTTKFGVFYYPVDMDIIKREWEILVGPVISEKSKIRSVEGNTLYIGVSRDLKPIIQISEINIKRSLLNKFLFLQNINYIWE